MVIAREASTGQFCSKAISMFEGMSAFEFREAFKSHDDCRRYLYDLKWSSDYRCRKCESRNFGKGRTQFHMRCKCCGYDESVTANTCFHKIKIPLLTSFEMAYRIIVSKKSVSSVSLSRDFAVSQPAAWFLKRRVQACISQGEWSPAEGEQVELSKEKYGQIDARETLVSWNSNYLISHEAKVDLNQKISIPSSAVKIRFFGPNVVFENFKLWLNGIHHYCSLRYLTAYLDEYFFRYRFRNSLHTALHYFLQRLVFSSPSPKLKRHLKEGT